MKTIVFSYSEGVSTEKFKDKQLIYKVENSDGSAKLCQRMLNADCLLLENKIVGKFDVYSYEFLSKKLLDNFLDLFSNSGKEERKEIELYEMLKSISEKQGEKEKIPDITRDNVITILSFILEGRIVYLVGEQEQNLANLRKILSLMPMQIANLVSYIVNPSYSLLGEMGEYNVILIDKDDTQAINILKEKGEELIYDVAKVTIKGELDLFNNEYFNALSNEDKNLQDFNTFISTSDYRKLGLEFTEIYSMFVYLFETDSSKWGYKRLLNHLSKFYYYFSNHEKADLLVVEVLDYFIYSYGDNRDEEFIKGYLDMLNDDNLRKFIDAVLRKKKRSTAYSLIFNILSDYRLSFTKCSFIPKDIEPMLVELASEVNKVPNNIMLINFMNNMKELSVDEIKSELIRMSNEKFSFSQILYYNKISYLAPIFDYIISLNVAQCDAYLISTFFSDTDSELQYEFSVLFFTLLVDKYKSSGAEVICDIISNILKILKKDNFVFSSAVEFDKQKRLDVLNDGIEYVIRTEFSSKDKDLILRTLNKYKRKNKFFIKKLGRLLWQNL